MAKLKIVLYKAKVLKDGRHKIRIALNHHHETRYIVTKYTLDSEEEFCNGKVVNRPDAVQLNRRLRSLLNEYEDRIEDIDNIDQYSITQLKDAITQKPSKTEFVTFGMVSKDYVSELKKEGRDSYASLIEYNTKEFLNYCNGDMGLSLITPQLITGYEKYLRKKGTLSNATVGMQLSRTKVIINNAIRNGKVGYDIHPFANVKIAASQPRECDISVESLNRVRTSEPGTKKLRIARDMFMLSFYMGGINASDLVGVDFRCERIDYVRTKTRNNTNGVQHTILTIPDDAREVAKKWMGGDGRLNFGLKMKYRDFLSYLSRGVKELGEMIGLDEHLTFYSARKTFAQMASELGEPDAVINYCLGHSTYSRGVIRFYVKVKPQRGDKTVARVIDYMYHPDKYADIVEENEEMLIKQG